MILSYRTNVRYRKEAEMTLEQLGQEYLRQAEDLKGVIKSCSARVVLRLKRRNQVLSFTKSIIK